jgi:type III secretory pathway component EscV
VAIEVDSERLAVASHPRWKKRVLRYLSRLLDDLGIGTSVDDLAVGRGQSHSERVPFRVRIHERPCRIPAILGLGAAPDDRALARTIARIIYENRELLLPAAATPSIAEGWMLLVRRHFGIGTAGHDRAPAPLPASPDVQPDQDEGDSAERVSVELSLGKDLIKALGGESKAMPELRTSLQRLEEIFFWELGVMLPEIRVKPATKLAGNQFRLKLNDVHLPPSPGLETNAGFVDATAADLRQLFSIEAEPAINPSNGKPGAIVRGNVVGRCREEGFVIWELPDFVVLTVQGELRRSADSFLTTSHIRYYLRLLRERFPSLVDAVQARPGTDRLTTILRQLVREQIPVRNLKAICEAVLAVAGARATDREGHVQLSPAAAGFVPSTRDKALPELDALDYVAGVRAILRRSVAHALGGGGQTIRVYELAPRVEQMLRERGDRLDALRHVQLVDAIVRTIPPWEGALQRPIIIAASDVRWSMRRLIEIEFPWLPVISPLELPAEKTPQVIGKIASLE